MWLTIQKAKDTLTDAKKRRFYDSTLPFDDEVPEKGDWKNDDEFYKIWHDVFDRNQMWSIKKPVPMLGDATTPASEVRAFYAFWNNFETWREWAQFDEHKPNESEDRYERRWMENENKKTRKTHEKKERARLIKLAETCYNNDPRIKAELAMAEAEKEAAKQLKKDFKANQAYERERVQREAAEKLALEAQQKLEVELLAKEEIRVTGIIFRSKVKELIELCKIKMTGTTFDKFWVEAIQKRFNTIEKISPIADFLENCETQEDFAEYMAQLLMPESERQKVVETSEADDGWTDEELAMLTQAASKYHPGSAGRWNKIQEAIGNEKDIKQIQKKV